MRFTYLLSFEFSTKSTLSADGVYSFTTEICCPTKGKKAVTKYLLRVKEKLQPRVYL